VCLRQEVGKGRRWGERPLIDPEGKAGRIITRQKRGGFLCGWRRSVLVVAGSFGARGSIARPECALYLDLPDLIPPTRNAWKPLRSLPMMTIVRFRRIPLATTVAALVGVTGNALVWSIGTRMDRMTIGVGEVVVASLLGALAGGIAFALCGRFARNPVRVFTGLSIAVVLLYIAGPLLAAREPYMEGAELFNTATVVAAQVMHLISAAGVWFAMTRLATDASSSRPAPGSARHLP